MDEDRMAADPEEQLPPASVLDSWDAVISDLQATSDEYRERGWEVVEVHPGDVATLTGNHANVDRYGIDLVVPGDEAERVHELVEAPDAAFDSCSVFRAVRSGIVFVIVAVEDANREVAVVAPAYYDTDDPQTQEMLDVAVVEGEMQTHVRDLGSEHVATFTHDDPSLFFAPTDE